MLKFKVLALKLTIFESRNSISQAQVSYGVCMAFNFLIQESYDAKRVAYARSQ